MDRLFRISFFPAVLDNCARLKVPVLLPAHPVIRSPTRMSLGWFLSRNAIRALAAKPRRLRNCACSSSQNCATCHCAICRFPQNVVVRAILHNRRGGKIVAGGASPRIGYCIYGAPAGRKAFVLHHLSVAPPRLRAVFRSNPGLAPGAIILPPLRGGAGGPSELRDGK
jgi:hypothetical protein